MESRSSRFTVLNNEKDTIYISKNLLTEMARKKQDGAPTSTTSGHESASSRQSSKPAVPDADVSPKTFDSHDLMDMPVSLDPEYVAKNIEFEPSTNLYGIHGKYERKLQQYQHAWRARWESLNSLNEKLFKLNSEKFANQVAKVEGKYFKHHVTAFEQPCRDNETRVINCFSLHGAKPLLCNEEISKFGDCVQKARIDTLKH